MDRDDELIEQNRVLRERIARLERAATSKADPVLLALLANTPDFMAAITPDGRMLASNRESRGFGSVLGRSVFEFINPSHHAVVRAAYAEACRTKKTVSHELVGFSQDGDPDHTYVTHVVPVVEGDRVTALVLVPTDITERVRLQRSLEESERAMRLALDATGMGVWRWDIPSDQVVWDARVRELFGVAETPKSAAAYEQLIHPDDRGLVHRVIEAAVSRGVFSPFEHRVATPPGAAERWLLAVGSVVKAPDGTPKAIVGGVLDVTARKQLALQVQRMERVEAMAQLTAGIAHNFNNLLAAILPNIEMVLRRAPEELHAPLSVALDASLQARELIKSIALLTGRSRATLGETIRPSEVVARIESLCRVTFPREIALVSTLDETAGDVPMPASDLEQVLLNLLLNARDAVLEASGRARRIEITLDRVTSAQAEPLVRIRVTDTGDGMNDAVRSQIFEPFFTTKPPHRGSGLGLSNALARVREAHGTLDCTSVPGVGTTFTLLLPEARATESPAPNPPSGRDRAPNGEAILLVDDEALVRQVVAEVLRGEHYEVLEAESAAEARRLLDRYGERVRLVLLDHSMPTESGAEALPSLRMRTDAKFVMFTGFTSEIPVGVTAVLDKPARADELCRVVRTVLDGSS